MVKASLKTQCKRNSSNNLWDTAVCQIHRILKSTAMFDGKLKKCSGTVLLVKDFGI